MYSAHLSKTVIERRRRLEETVSVIVSFLRNDWKLFHILVDQLMLKVITASSLGQNLRQQDCCTLLYFTRHIYLGPALPRNYAPCICPKYIKTSCHFSTCKHIIIRRSTGLNDLETQPVFFQNPKRKILGPSFRLIISSASQVRVYCRKREQPSRHASHTGTLYINGSARFTPL